MIIDIELKLFCVIRFYDIGSEIVYANIIYKHNKYSNTNYYPKLVNNA